MKKIEAEIKINYTFDNNRKGAKYTLNGLNWMNHGEFAEVVTKNILGFESVKDANTAFDKGSDIPEIKASVKSSKASLTSMKLADTFEESMNEYFKRTHSEIFIYTVIIDENATLYMMNEKEFRLFMMNFSSLNERKVIRFKATSGKMVKFLESLA